jgi:hypothetical protein
MAVKEQNYAHTPARDMNYREHPFLQEQADRNGDISVAYGVDQSLRTRQDDGHLRRLLHE